MNSNRNIESDSNKLVSSLSKSLDLYVNCKEINGILVESFLSKEPRYQISDDSVAARIAKYLDGEVQNLDDIKFELKGTDFQVAVWKELSKIPKGTTVTYGEIAKRISNHRASRAVGRAVGSNKLTIVVPCHRVVAVNGMGGYSAEGGLETKKKILNMEMTR